MHTTCRYISPETSVSYLASISGSNRLPKRTVLSLPPIFNTHTHKQDQGILNSFSIQTEKFRIETFTVSNLHIVLRPPFNLTTIFSSLSIERIDRLLTTRDFSSTLYYHTVNSGKYLYMYSYIAFYFFFFSLSTTSLPLPLLYTAPFSVTLSSSSTSNDPCRDNPVHPRGANP